MYEEGFLDAIPKGRLAKYQEDENVLLCLAWKKISIDAAIGAEQLMATYWKWVKE